MEPEERARRAVIACARRIARAGDAGPWPDSTRATVLAALLDRSDDLKTIQEVLESAAPAWQHADAFARWIETIARSWNVEDDLGSSSPEPTV